MAVLELIETCGPVPFEPEGPGMFPVKSRSLPHCGNGLFNSMGIDNDKTQKLRHGLIRVSGRNAAGGVW